VCAWLQKRQLLVHRPVLHVSSPMVLVIVVVKEGYCGCDIGGGVSCILF
jgi:hypothetical protein